MDWYENYYPTCPGCWEIYDSRKPPEMPPCETCKIELLEENADAGAIYNLVKRQVIISMDTVIDLNYGTVIEIMKLYGIKNQKQCLNKVIHTFHHFLRKRKE